MKNINSSNFNPRISIIYRLFIIQFILLISQTHAQTYSFNVVPTVKDLINENSLFENNVIKVLGYYEVGDGGSAEYIIKNDSQRQESESEYYIELNNGKKAYLLEPSIINYKMFGAKGDGVNNDAIQISTAHEYANAKNLPVINTKGEFWLKEVHRINIETNVEWGSTIFYIDEKFNTKQDPRFEVRSKYRPQEIKFSKEEKKELLSHLNSGATIIPILEPYKNHLLIMQDTQDRVGYRYGARYNAHSWAKEDLFYVEEAGKIIGDITWSFNDYTKLTAYPVDKNWLNIQGGIFYLSGDSPSSESGYYKNGIQIRRSKTAISNQWVGMQPGKLDTITINPRTGFYAFNNVYDVKLENVRLIPYLLIRESGRNVEHGTYGISMGRVLKSHFKNITAEGSRNHWGVFGTNINKDFKIEDSNLNRVDVHFHCWNLTILNSHIGKGGIAVTGGGNLIIDRASCSGNSFVNFRSDYGAKWDGDVTITNSTFKVKPNVNNVYILYFRLADFDFGYPVRFGRNIKIENFKVDYSGAENKETNCWLMEFPKFAEMKVGDGIILPSYMDFKNIEVVGREQGLRLFSLSDQNGYRAESSNSNINFKNIQLEDLANEEEQFHLSIYASNKLKKDQGFYPAITFENCYNIALFHDGAIGNMFFDKSSISNISSGKEQTLKGRFSFNNCDFYPIIKNKDEDIYSLQSTVGTFFTNCVFNEPKYQEKKRSDLINKTGIYELNNKEGFYHTNTVLKKGDN